MKLSLTVCLLMIVAAPVLAHPPADEGKTLFVSRCAGCHSVNKTLTGPALAGIDERRDMNWIKSFIRSSQSMVRAGDATAVQLFEQYNKIPMPDHMDLSDDDINSIVDYIKSEKKDAAEQAPFNRPSKLRPSYVPLSKDNWGIGLIYLALVALLVFALLLAVRVSNMRKKMVK